MNCLERDLVRHCLIAFAIVLPGGAFAQDGPDVEALRKSIVVVVAKGNLPARGNVPVVAQGTGFFVSRDGYLVTAYHLRSDLDTQGGAVDDGTVTYAVHFGPSSGDTLPARPYYVNAAADIMVLFAPVGERPVESLKPSDRSQVLLGKTDIYAAGYPAGYQYTVDKGVVKSFGITGPMDIWATSLSFKSGQSGSPICLSNNRVVAMVLATDHDAASIGLAVPIRLVPREYWDGGIVVNAAADSASRDLTVPLDHITIQSDHKPTDVVRVHYFEFASDECDGPSRESQEVRAREGWAIDPSSIRLETEASVGIHSTVSVDNKSKGGFRISAGLVNEGQCLNVFGGQILADVPARVTGRVSYRETPSRALREPTLVADVAVIGELRIPLPRDWQTLQYAFRNSDGTVRTFRPRVEDVILMDDGQALLDVERVRSSLASFD